MEKSIRKGSKRFGQEDADFQHCHGGECRRSSSTVPQNLVGKEVRNLELEWNVPISETTVNSQEDQELKNIGLSSGSVRQTKSSNAFAGRGTMELKRGALSESVATTSQPNKKRRLTTTKREMQWQRKLRDLQEFFQSHGHCMVPQSYAQNSPLGCWVHRMRMEFKKWENAKESALTTERIAALNKLGFDWVLGRGNGVPITSQGNKKREMKWQTRLQELQEFHQIHGHSRVRRGYPRNPSLGSWVSIMRMEFKKWEERKESALTTERIAALNNLGFNWVVGSGRPHGSGNDAIWKPR